MGTDYSTYRMKRKEIRDYVIIGGICIFWGTYLFYKDTAVSFFLMLALYPLKDLWEEVLRKRRLRNMMASYKDFLYLLSGCLASGRQLPDAVESAASQIKASYGEKNDLYLELSEMMRKYKDSHEEISVLFEDLGMRSGIRDIRSFAQGCRICGRCGTDLQAVALKNASALIDKLEFQAEVEALARRKRLEGAVLAAMPFGILFFINIVSEEYLEPLYSGLQGRLIMTISLVLIFFSVIICIKLLDIEV